MGGLDVFKLLEGDSLEILGAMENESIDAVITDPPYGVNISKLPYSYKKQTPGEDIDWDRALPISWIDRAADVLRPGGNMIIFTAIKYLSHLWDYCESIGLKNQRPFFWVKANPPPIPHKNFQNAVEVAVFTRKPGKCLFWDGGGATPNYYKAPLALGLDRTEHPTQKSLSLMRHLVRLLCPPGGVVLDPFGGSGTTAVAAMLEKRQGILVERDPTYCKIARERLRKWENTDQVRQMDLFV
jgi:site-specific DNA-methyltransferase (adenine-specific)